ncbi:PAS domain S-box protein [Inquilinus sp. KBS0705]|nr:PAS domain S-box protein [Inquilinus sp. KBS0705]
MDEIIDQNSGHNQNVFKTIIEQSPSPVGLYVGPDIVITLANASILKVWDKDASVIGKTFRQALPELEGQPFFDILDRVYATGIPYEAYAERVDLLSGGNMQTFYFNFIYQPIKDDKGKVWAILNTAEDVTELVLTRQKLAENEERSRFALNSAELGAWHMDPANNVITWDDRCSHMHGFKKGELKYYQDVLKYIHPDDHQIITDNVSRVLNPNGTGLLDETFRVIDPEDKTIRWLRSKGKAYFDDKGNCIRFAGITQDITTEVKDKEEQKQLQRQKDDFLGIASHELKTPVTSIKAYAQVLGAMLSKEGEDKKAAMVLKMDAQINRLTNLIGDLLDVTKINSGRIQFNKNWFNFNQAVQDTVQDLQHTANKHLLVMDFKDTGEVYADKERLGQVITNLITNAIKYSPQANRVVISTELVDNEIIVCVQDFGIGIADDKKDRVFEQFYRVSGDKQHTFPGLGLGLYISSEIIKREGGRMWVNSIEGKGSTFCFSLPAKPNDNNSSND